jgi:hypothetical protein
MRGYCVSMLSMDAKVTMGATSGDNQLRGVELHEPRRAPPNGLSRRPA